MIEVRQTPLFKKWLNGLKDKRAAARIATRIVRVQSGLMGDVKFFGGIGELRVDYGPGYRVYLTKRGDVVIFLLCGGDKSTQKKDIKLALELAEEI